MMTDNYKILAQDTAASIEENSGENQANILYTVPANTQAAVSSISLINTSEENVEYSLGVVKAEDVDNSSEEINYSEGFKLFVASGTGSNIKYSSDGVSWVTTSGPPTNSIAYGAGKFVAAGSSWSYSTNGTSWTEVARPSNFTNSSNHPVVYGDGKFVAAISYGSAGAYSTDGITWTQTAMPATKAWDALAYGDGKFVALGGENSQAAYSTDGVSWASSSSVGTNGSWISVVYGDGKFVAVSLSMFQTAAYSTDGITWTQITLPNPGQSGLGAQYLSIAHGNDMFVAISNKYGQAYSAFSTDGVDWFSAYLGTGSWSSITYGDNKFVAVSGDGRSAISTDGVNWTINQGDVAYLSEVAYGDSLEDLQATVLNLSSSQTIVPTRSIAPNAVDEIVGGITLSAGDQVRVFSESSDLVVQVYGVEIA